MSERNKANTVAFYKKAFFERDVEYAFRSYAGSTYRQHNPLVEDGMEGVRKLVANHQDAHGEIKRVFADGDYVTMAVPAVALQSCEAKLPSSVF